MKKLILGLLLSTMLCVTACGNDTTTDKNTTDKGVVGDTGEALEDGAEELGDDVRDGVEGVGDTLERNMDNATGSENSSENSNAMGTRNGNATRQKERVCFLAGSFSVCIEYTKYNHFVNFLKTIE